MSFSNQFEADILGLIFNATAISGLADNASASPLTNLYVALHTADPGLVLQGSGRAQVGKRCVANVSVVDDVRAEDLGARSAGQALGQHEVGAVGEGNAVHEHRDDIAE